MTRDRRLSWINGLLLPLFNVLTAFLAMGVVFLLIGVDPIEATKILIYGSRILSSYSYEEKGKPNAISYIISAINL